MKKKDLNESIIGRRAVGYYVWHHDDFENKIVGKITAFNSKSFSVCIERQGYGSYWIHCSAVRLLKKKQAPVYWVHKNALMGHAGWVLLSDGKHGPDYARVKLVELKDKK